MRSGRRRTRELLSDGQSEEVSELGLRKRRRTWTALDAGGELLEIDVSARNNARGPVQMGRMKKAVHARREVRDSTEGDARNTIGEPRRAVSEADSEMLMQGDFVGEETTGSTPPASAHPRRRALSQIVIPGPALPRSAFEGWTPPLRLIPENEALRELGSVDELPLPQTQEAEEGYTYYELIDFSIYNDAESKRRPLDMVTLDRVANQAGCDRLRFDGILSRGNERRYVQNVSFAVLAVDGYGDADVVDLKDRICIQSPFAQQQDVWYRLGTPSPEYRRFYDPFVWLATFTKFFVEFLLDNDGVRLQHFRSGFYEWVEARYGNSAAFTLWLESCNNLRDFRTTITANVGYLHKEAFSLDGGYRTRSRHPIWGEVDPLRLTAITEQRNLVHRTVVTPYTYRCFKHMYFDTHLQETPLKGEVVAKIDERKRALSLTPRMATPVTDNAITLIDVESSRPVRQGDVVCRRPDSDSAWQSTSAFWYAYVQAVRPTARNGDLLDVLWLYEAADTTLGAAYYAYKNELFLSDNCGCGSEALESSAVIGRVNVEWHVTDPNAVASGSFFVRQKFRTVHEENTYDFAALRREDFVCRCGKPLRDFEECVGKYAVGDTVLFRECLLGGTADDDVLDPAQLVGFDREKRRVLLRRLLRAQRDRPSAQPNELALTQHVFNVGPSMIIRKCQVRVFDKRDLPSIGRVPFPFDRGGAGDFFYVLVDVDQEDGTTDSDVAEKLAFPPLPRGWNDIELCAKQPLTGMGIFCGGGNFDRGLEEGGAVRVKYAVDWAEHALHSYRANVERPEDVHFFLGSVNDYLAQAIAGSQEIAIARVGDVDVLIAGSPCPGFSNLQVDKQSEKSKSMASLVASVLSYVDFWSPRYLILENVVSMTHKIRGTDESQKVFPQILAALVGLGYQVQQFNVDAWSYGSPQRRSRLFIVASAPGLEPLEELPHSHAHPSAMQMRETNLGRSSNGRRFGTRREYDTPFPHVSAQEATKDLPDIADSQPQICPAFPDHRTATEERYASRQRVAMVPILPYGMSIRNALDAGRLPPDSEPANYLARTNALRQAKGSKGYCRAVPTGLFNTIVTAPHIADANLGGALHWQQHRTLTVLEARRAQGVLDHEVIVGSPAQQWKIVGNSVDRKVAFTLGLALGKSWGESGHNPLEEEEMTPSEQSPPPLRLSENVFLAIRKGGFKAINQLLRRASGRKEWAAKGGLLTPESIRG